MLAFFHWHSDNSLGLYMARNEVFCVHLLMSPWVVPQDHGPASLSNAVVARQHAPVATRNLVSFPDSNLTMHGLTLGEFLVRQEPMCLHEHEFLDVT